MFEIVRVNSETEGKEQKIASEARSCRAMNGEIMWSKVRRRDIIVRMLA